MLEASYSLELSETVLTKHRNPEYNEEGMTSASSKDAPGVNRVCKDRIKTMLKVFNGLNQKAVVLPPWLMCEVCKWWHFACETRANMWSSNESLCWPDLSHGVEHCLEKKTPSPHIEKAEGWGGSAKPPKLHVQLYQWNGGGTSEWVAWHSPLLKGVKRAASQHTPGMGHWSPPGWTYVWMVEPPLVDMTATWESKSRKQTPWHTTTYELMRD